MPLGSRPKACLITHEYPPTIGGVGHSAARVASLLIASGLDIEVLVITRTDDRNSPARHITSTEENGILVHRASAWAEGWSADYAKRLPMDANAIGRFNQESFEILLSLQRKREYDLLHGFFLYPGGFIATAVAQFIGIKSIVSIRGDDIGRYAFDPSIRPFVVAALEQANFVTSVATSLLTLATTTVQAIRGASEVILNSIDEDCLLAEPDALRLAKPILGSIGVFRHKKGLLQLFEALAQIKSRHDFTLLLAGGFADPREERLHLDRLRDLGLLSRTHITGLLPHSKLQGHIRVFDVVVFPSLFSEGCPLSMLEAMACGRAVVASRSGAMPEVIEDERSGLLFDQGDVASLVDQLDRLLKSSELRRSLGDGATRRVDQLNPRAEGAQWAKVYNDVLGRR